MKLASLVFIGLARGLAGALGRTKKGRDETRVKSAWLDCPLHCCRSHHARHSELASRGIDVRAAIRLSLPWRGARAHRGRTRVARRTIVQSRCRRA